MLPHFSFTQSRARTTPEGPQGPRTCFSTSPHGPCSIPVSQQCQQGGNLGFQQPGTPVLLHLPHPQPVPTPQIPVGSTSESEGQNLAETRVEFVSSRGTSERLRALEDLPQAVRPSVCPCVCPAPPWAAPTAGSGLATSRARYPAVNLQAPPSHGLMPLQE